MLWSLRLVAGECNVPNAHCIFIDLQIDFRTKA